MLPPLPVRTARSGGAIYFTSYYYYGQNCIQQTLYSLMEQTSTNTTFAFTSSEICLVDQQNCE